MNEDRRVLLAITISRNSVGFRVLFIHLTNQAQQHIGTIRNVKVGPADTLNLDNLARFGFGVIIVGDVERSFNVSRRLFSGFGRSLFRESEIEAGRGTVSSIIATGLRDNLEMNGTVLLFFPVIPTLDRSSFELFRQPALSVLHPESIGRYAKRGGETHMTMTRTSCSQIRVQKSRYVASNGP